jgi:hypothetical protein
MPPSDLVAATGYLHRRFARRSPLRPFACALFVGRFKNCTLPPPQKKVLNPEVEKLFITFKRKFSICVISVVFLSQDLCEVLTAD